MWPFNRKQQEPDIETPLPGFDPPRVFKLPAKPVAKHQTAADALDCLCSKHKATYERERQGANVRIRVLLPSGDVVAGNGDTTMAAVADVSAKVEAMSK